MAEQGALSIGELDARVARACDRTGRAAATLLHAPFAGVRVMVGGGLTIAAATGVHRTKVGRILDEDDMLWLPDLAEGPERLRYLIGEGIRAIGGVRVPTGDRRASVEIWVGDAVPREWGAADIEAARELAESVRCTVELRQMVIDHARLGDELQRVSVRSADLTSGLNDAFCVLDREWRYTFVNAAVEAMVGMSREELLGRSIWEVRPDLVGSIFEQRARHAAEEGVGTTFEAHYPTFDRWVLTHLYPFDGGVLVATHDVSDRREAESKTAAAEAHYRRVVENLPDAVYVLDLEGRFTEINPAGEHILGRAARDLLGRPYSEVIPGWNQAPVTALFEGVIRGEGESRAFDTTVVRPTGEERQVEITVAPIRVEGRIVGVHGIARDVTRERQAQHALRQSEENFRQIAENVREVFWIFTPDFSRVLYMSPVYEQIWGRPVTDLESDALSFVDAVHPDDVDGLRRAMELIVDQMISVEYRVMRPDGSIRWVHTRGFPVVDEEGRVYRVVGTAEDTTERRLRDQQVRRAERLASVATLVGGVAHELNNPLHAVLNFAQLLALDEHDPERREDLATIQREAERMGRIIVDLKQIARSSLGGAMDIARVDVDEVVRSIVRAHQGGAASRGVHLAVDLDGGLETMRGDRVQIEQIIANLVSNAIDAVEVRSRGQVTVRTRSTRTGVVLEVADDGPGIPTNLLQRIFDPFFTTKPPGEGTGLGLSLVHRAVEDHNGEIRVESTVGEGTTVRIELPFAGPRNEDPHTVAFDPASSEPIRILVIDDEPSVRSVLSRHFGRSGHTVVEAADGDAAVRLLETVEFDVIVSDVRMPGIRLEVLLERLEEKGLAERLILLTGDRSALSGLPDTVDAPVFEKPVNLAALKDVVEGVGRRVSVPG